VNRIEGRKKLYSSVQFSMKRDSHSYRLKISRGEWGGQEVPDSVWAPKQPEAVFQAEAALFTLCRESR
jgi:hypothetical protein